MATTPKYRFGVTNVKRGGKKGHEYIICFTPGDGSLLVPQPDKAKLATAKKFARAAAKVRSGPQAKGPLGTTTIIPNPANPPAIVIADDVSVRIGGVPISTPTVGSGYLTALTAATVAATTGQLAAGVYRVEVVIGYSGILAAGKEVRVEHRNAADSGLIHTLGMCVAGSQTHFVLERVVIAQNERIRIINSLVAAAAGETIAAQIRVYLLPV